MVVTGTEHNFELDEPICDLEDELRQMVREIPVSVMAFPQGRPDAESAFFDRSGAFKIYADSGSTSASR